MDIMKRQTAMWKTGTCMILSTFYFAMLAYPFGVTQEGYAIERMMVVGFLFFAISIPTWIINIRREFFTEQAVVNKKVIEAKPEKEIVDISQLAVLNKWLSPNEVKQIVYCQEFDGMSFDKVAIKRNFLTIMQVRDLFELQRNARSKV